MAVCDDGETTVQDHSHRSCRCLGGTHGAGSRERAIHAPLEACNMRFLFEDRSMSCVRSSRSRRTSSPRSRFMRRVAVLTVGLPLVVPPGGIVLQSVAATYDRMTGRPPASTSATRPSGSGGIGSARCLPPRSKKRRIDGMKSSDWRWHLDEVFMKINGERHYLWQAVDYEGEVLESFVTRTRDKKAALKFLKKAMKKYGWVDVLVSDKLRSFGSALRDLGAADRRETGRWLNNRVENSHLPFRRRERAMLRFRRVSTLRKHASVLAAFSNPFNLYHGLSSRAIFKQNRAAARAEWRGLGAG